MNSYKDFLYKYIYNKENIKSMIVINITIIIISCTSLLAPYFSKIVVNAITGVQNSGEVNKYFIIFVIVTICALMISVVQNVLSTIFIESVVYRLRQKIFTNILKKRKAIESGQEIYNLFTSLPIVCSSGIFLPTNLLVATIVLIIANILLFIQSYMSVIIVNSCLLINVVVYSIYFKKAKVVIEESQNITAKQYENIKNQLDHYKLIFDFDTDEFEEKEFMQHIDEVKITNINKGIVLSKYSSIFSSISSLISIAVLYIGYLLALNDNYSIGDILILSSFISILMPYTNKVIDTLNQYPNILVNIQRIKDYLFAEIKINEYGSKDIKYIESIEMRNLNFSFGKNVIFDNYDMIIDNDVDLVLLKGKSGVGKSTLLNIIYTNYACNEYFINCASSLTYKKENIRSCLSYYHNNHTLINGSIIDNLTYGSTLQDLEKVMSICKLTEIHERIMELPNNYYTQIKYNDLILSTGEVQRVCLARTLLKEANFYLLDEPFSNLDKDLANQILHNLKMSKKKCLIISHGIDNDSLFTKIIELKR